MLDIPFQILEKNFNRFINLFGLEIFAAVGFIVGEGETEIVIVGELLILFEDPPEVD